MIYTQEKTDKWLERITEKIKDNPKWAKVFQTCFTNTLDKTIKILDDQTTFVLTGDIPAMWLRDSTAQIKPYLFLAKEDTVLKKTIKGLIARQFDYILLDPYANAFNDSENFKGHHETDHTELNGFIWERKYEIDSLCYPVQLAYLYWKETGDTTHFTPEFFKALALIVHTWQIEQYHEEKSSYTFQRDTDRQEDTLVRQGKGPICVYTGMTWSGFRPSDDACMYSYLIPSNMFAVVVLRYMEEIVNTFPQIDYPNLKQEIVQLYQEIDQGIKNYGLAKNKQGETIFAFEVDGLGNQNIMDDPNVPSLLAAPYLGYCAIDDAVYQATRKTILSEENPYYYTGKYAAGLGSSHTFYRYIWPIALAIQGLTTSDKQEKKRLLDLMVECDGGTGVMHESFHVDDPTHYSREWFSWANMMFCELVLDYYDLRMEI